MCRCYMHSCSWWHVGVQTARRSRYICRTDAVILTSLPYPLDWSYLCHSIIFYNVTSKDESISVLNLRVNVLLRIADAVKVTSARHPCLSCGDHDKCMVFKKMKKKMQMFWCEQTFYCIFTCANGSRLSNAIIRMCMWFFLFVRTIEPKWLKAQLPILAQG